MSKEESGRRPAYRRGRSQASLERVTTSLVGAVVRNPAQAAAMLESDLKQGGDPEIILGVLDAVEASLALRGIDRRSHLAALRNKVRRWGLRRPDPPPGR